MKPIGERWKEELKKSMRLYANSYGAGADCGSWDACNVLLADINEFYLI